MTIRIIHAKVSGKAAGTDPNRVYGTHWDADHTVTGLENVDNTSDLNKPVSTATQTALDAKQNLDATLTALAGVTTAADKVIYATGSDAFVTTDLTSTARSLLDDTSTSAMRTTLGLAIGTDVQAYDSDLAAVAALATNGLVARTGTGTVATRTVTAPAAGITVSNGDGVSGNPTLVLANDLSALEGLGSTGIAVRTTTDTWAQRTLQAPAAGITITNPAGVAGDPTLVLANDLSALEGLSSTGIARRTGTDAWSVGTLVTNAELATAAAYTFKGNATGSTAAPTDFTIAGLTQKSIPTGSDKIIISDAAASGATKYSTIGNILANVASPFGVVRMLYSGSAWLVYAPDGTAVSTAGTTTSGLQELINYASTNGYPWKVVGPGVTSAGSRVATLMCTTAVNIPAADYMYGSIEGCIISWSGVTGNLFNINTQSNSIFEFHCGFERSGGNASDSTILINPTVNTPLGGAHFQQTRIEFGSVTQSGSGLATGALVFFADSAAHAIINSKFKFGGLDGGGLAAYGIKIDNALLAINDIEIDFDLIVNCKVNEILEGAVGLVNPLANITYRGSLEISYTHTDAVKAYGIGCTYIISSLDVNAGTLTNAFNFGATAVDNTVICPLVVATTAMVVDAGARNKFIDGFAQANFSVHKSGDQTGIVPSTPTKVTWDTIDYDNHNRGSGAFSTANGWYVAPFRGILHVQAYYRCNANFTSGANETIIYVNGSAVKHHLIGGFTGNNDTMMIAADVKVSVGDTVAIWTTLVGAGNKTLPGNSSGYGGYQWFSGHYVGAA